MTGGRDTRGRRKSSGERRHREVARAGKKWRMEVLPGSRKGDHERRSLDKVTTVCPKKRLDDKKSQGGPEKSS